MWPFHYTLTWWPHCYTQDIKVVISYQKKYVAHLLLDLWQHRRDPGKVWKFPAGASLVSPKMYIILFGNESALIRGCEGGGWASVSITECRPHPHQGIIYLWYFTFSRIKMKTSDYKQRHSIVSSYNSTLSYILEGKMMGVGIYKQRFR